MRVEDIKTISETMRLKTVTGESTPIMGETSVEIYIGQLRKRHRVFVAGMDDDFVFGMDLISHHRLTVVSVKELLRVENEEFKLNQRCIEAKYVRFLFYSIMFPNRRPNYRETGRTQHPEADRESNLRRKV